MSENDQTINNVSPILIQQLLRAVRAVPGRNLERTNTNQRFQTGLVSAIVSHVEVNDHHGVGVIIKRYFGDLPNVVSIRSRDLYSGEQSFGAVHLRIQHESRSRDSVYMRVIEAIGGITPDRIVCIPYYPDDVWNAIALRDLFGIPLCTFLMDDQNINSQGIPDAMMAELLTKSKLRLAISERMSSAYRHKYKYDFHYMPPLVPSRLVAAQLIQPQLQPDLSTVGAFPPPLILGNIWGQSWVQLLRDTVRCSGLAIPWYNSSSFPWLPCSLEELAADGIIAQTGAAHSDEAIVAILRTAPFVILPSGAMDDRDERRFIAQLSLPSRIPFILATSQAPILVLGHPDTAAAQFVTEKGIGFSVPYCRWAFKAAVARLFDPEVNRQFRQAALLLAHRYLDIGAAEWIWTSLARGGPVDGRFQAAQE